MISSMKLRICANCSTCRSEMSLMNRSRRHPISLVAWYISDFISDDRCMLCLSRCCYMYDLCRIWPNSFISEARYAEHIWQ